MLEDRIEQLKEQIESSQKGLHKKKSGLRRNQAKLEETHSKPGQLWYSLFVHHYQTGLNDKKRAIQEAVINLTECESALEIKERDDEVLAAEQKYRNHAIKATAKQALKKSGVDSLES